VAGFLSERPTRDLDVVAGAGPALPLDEMAESYRLATRALITAQKFGMRGVQDISSVGLRAAMVADTEVGKAMQTRYVGPLRDSGGVSFHLCKSEVVHHRTAVGADRRSVL
jgi:hypothetical protein